VTEKCQLLHTLLEDRPLIKYPFELKELPLNGIYFFYEDGEFWGHKENKLRIVRIGTHKGDNFRSRISEHYLFNEKKMDFGKDNQKPSDRSIFRKNIGRAFLNKTQDDYLEVWNIDFTERDKRNNFGHLRNIPKEKKVEENITKFLRENFYFRFIEIPDEELRIGKSGLEKNLIGTVNQCKVCMPSEEWFGQYSPIIKIRTSGMWQTQHLKNPSLTSHEINKLIAAIDSEMNLYAVEDNKSKSIINTSREKLSDWGFVWEEIITNLIQSKPCKDHLDYLCIHTLALGEVNDIISINKDGITLRSHRYMNENFIEVEIFEKWWKFLKANGKASTKTDHEYNPHPYRSSIVGAIMGTCLPNRTRVVNKNLIELID